MKIRVIALGLAFSLLICSGNLAAKERRGAEIKILKKDKTFLNGELIAVKPASLLLMDSQSGADVSVGIEDISTVTVIKKSKALAGFLIGTGAGLLAGLAIESSGGPSEGFGPSDETVAGLFVWIGLSLGGFITGALMGKDQTIQIVGMSPGHIKSDLEKLRRQARITNFQ